MQGEESEAHVSIGGLFNPRIVALLTLLLERGERRGGELNLGHRGHQLWLLPSPCAHRLKPGTDTGYQAFPGGLGSAASRVGHAKRYRSEHGRGKQCLRVLEIFRGCEVSREHSTGA